MPNSIDHKFKALPQEIVVIDDEEFYQDMAQWSLADQNLDVSIFSSTDAFFTKWLSVPKTETPGWILVDWFGPESDVIEEGFPSNCRKLGVEGKIILWSNLRPNQDQLNGFDGFLSKGLTLNLAHLNSSLF